MQEQTISYARRIRSLVIREFQEGVMEFILQICERTNKIENDGTYHHHWCRAGGV
jgi:histone H3/H4